MSTFLSVNLNKIALLRNSRKTNIPSVIDAAETCIKAGAQGITVHPRPDMRHIVPSDVYALADLLKKPIYSHIEFNIEGNPFAGPEANGYPGFMSLVEEVHPHQCTLVPDSPNQITSDHGWDLTVESNQLKPIVEKLHAEDIRLSLFMDPDNEQIRLAHHLGADRIEFFTGPYAELYGTKKGTEILETYTKAGILATSLGLGINAGHDLNQENLRAFCTGVPNIAEVSIGHAIITDALSIGLSETVLRYRKILNLGTSQKNLKTP